MLKKVLLASAVLAYAVNAYAADASSTSYYARVDGAYNFGVKMSGVSGYGTTNLGYATKKYKKTMGGQIGFGMYLPYNFRSDLTVGFGSYKLNMSNASKQAGFNAAFANSTFKVDNTNVMLNGYYDITDISGFKPYVTAGLGYSSNKLKNSLIAQKVKRTNALAWQAGAGVSYDFNENVAVDLGYRYMDLGKAAKSSSLSAAATGTTLNGKALPAYAGKKPRLTTNQVQFGVRFSF